MAQDTKKQDLSVSAAPGRVTVDSRGNSVWQWNDDDPTGSTSVLLKSLDNDALAIEPTACVPVPAAARVQATGGESTESTSVVLQRLYHTELAIEPTWTVPILNGLGDRAGGPRRRRRHEPGTDDDTAAPVGGGFNPYDRS